MDIEFPNIARLLDTRKGVLSVAEHLSHAHVRERLVPVLDQTYDIPRVRPALSRNLGNLIEFVGGPLHSDCLLPLLDKLVKDENVTVWDEALKSLKKIAGVVPPNKIDAFFSPIIRRLCDHPLETARVAAVHLIAICYKSTTGFRSVELKNLYCTLGRDGSIRVRQAVVTQLMECIKQVDPKDVEFDWFPLMSRLINDNADAVKADAAAAKPLWKDELDWNSVPRNSKLWIWTGKCRFN